MTGKVINLNRARKARARDEARQDAEVNAAQHGRTKAERLAEKARAAQDDAKLDGHKRDE
ncbi:MAG: DUF4169 family protein [Pseudomonadota bacterium]